MKIDSELHKMKKNTVFNKSILLDCYKDIIKIIKSNEVVKPYIAEIFPSTLCNYKCTGCHSSELIHTDGKRLNLDLFKNLVDELLEMKVKGVILSGGGEPLTNPCIGDMLKYVKEKGLNILLITNGFLLNDHLTEIICETADIVRISMNASDRDSYQEFYGVDGFQRVLDNIKKLVDYRDSNQLDMDIGIKSLISCSNYQQVGEIVELAKQTGVNYLQFKLLRGCSEEISDTHLLLDLAETLKTLRDENEHLLTLLYELENTQLEHKCYMHQLQPVIGSGGELYVCSYFHNKYSYGDLTKMTFQEIWYGEAHKKVIAMDTFDSCNMLDCNYHRINNQLYHKFVRP